MACTEQTIKCPNCELVVSNRRWPFCTHCGLLMVALEDLELDPEAPLETWQATKKIERLN